LILRAAGQLVAEAKVLAATDDPAALFTQLSRMTATGAENAAVKSALVAAEFDLRTAAPDVAADLTRHVSDLLDRAHAVGAVRHANAETSQKRSAHLAQISSTGYALSPGKQRTHRLKWMQYRPELIDTFSLTPDWNGSRQRPSKTNFLARVAGCTVPGHS
jgi:hypothetical protein